MTFPSRQLVAAAAAAAWLAAIPAAAGSSVQGSSGELSPEAFIDIYRQTLADLGANPAEHPFSVERLAAAEARFLGDSPEQNGKRLARAELDVARVLARRDLETLVPVIVLHHDLAVEHKRHQRPLLVRHSMEILTLLADFYAREGASEGSRRTAASALVSLGGHLQAGGRRSSLALFDRSLELDPGNAAALLGSAMHYEKRGGPYERVVDILERLQQANPEHREGRLRLAINLRRLDQADQATELLEGLVAGDENDWIFSLAAQELARSRATDPSSAIAVLEEAVQRRPDDQKLHLQLAFLRDRNRQARAAGQLAERLQGGLPPSAPTRGIYNQWPDRDLASLREELRQNARTRRPLLTAALAGTEGAR